MHFKNKNCFITILRCCNVWFRYAVQIYASRDKTPKSTGKFILKFILFQDILKDKRSKIRGCMKDITCMVMSRWGYDLLYACRFGHGCGISYGSRRRCQSSIVWCVRQCGQCAFSTKVTRCVRFGDCRWSDGVSKQLHEPTCHGSRPTFSAA